MNNHRRMLGFLAAIGLTAGLATSARAVTYNWVDGPDIPRGYLGGSFTVADEAVSDGIINASEFSAFDFHTVDGAATTATGSFSLDADFNVVGGSLFAAVLDYVFNSRIYDANLFADHLTLSDSANLPFGTGYWEYEARPVIPPQGVPDTTSSAAALGLSLLMLSAARRRQRRTDSRTPAAAFAV